MRFLVRSAGLALILACRVVPAKAQDPRVTPDPSNGGVDPMRAPVGLFGSAHWIGDSTELALIEQLKRLYPGKKGEDIERELRSPTTWGMKMSDSTGQAILDRI